MLVDPTTPPLKDSFFRVGRSRFVSGRRSRCARVPALALLFAFTAGLCLGRAVSWLADGAPNVYVRFFFALEAVGAAAAAALLFASR